MRPEVAAEKLKTAKISSRKTGALFNSIKGREEALLALGINQEQVHEKGEAGRFEITGLGNLAILKEWGIIDTLRKAVLVGDDGSRGSFSR